jgi:hypothetical protein
MSETKRNHWPYLLKLPVVVGIGWFLWMWLAQ